MYLICDVVCIISVIVCDFAYIDMYFSACVICIKMALIYSCFNISGIVCLNGVYNLVLLRNIL